MTDLNNISFLYLEEKLTMRQIADMKGCNPMTISRHLRKLGVAARQEIIDWSDLEELYVLRGMSTNEIAKIKGTQPRIVRHHLKSIGVSIRSKSESQLVSWQSGRRVKRYKCGSEHASWKGGRCKDVHGYIKVYCPEHPYAYKNYVLEHRLMVERRLGRYLYPWELVHHINGVKDDNWDENLQVLPSQSEHLPSIATQRRLNKLECDVVDLKKENRLLKWQIRQLNEQLQYKLYLDKIPMVRQN